MNEVVTCSDLVHGWSFRPSEPTWKKRVRRAQTLLLRRRPRPATAVIKPVFPAQRWSVLFLFCPDDRLSSSQLFSLQRLRDTDVPLLVIAATRAPRSMPEGVQDLADALIWKSLSGYDFSAYTIALEVLAVGSAGADVFVMNDSVFGPFHDVIAHAFSSPWEMAAWTACGKFENHVQSYAFAIKALDGSKLKQLRPVFFEHYALDDPLDVVLCQETRLARVAARAMSVGAMWAPRALDVDVTLTFPFELMRHSFPFLKKSLLGKYSRLQSRSDVLDWLSQHHHPAVEST